MSKSYYEKLKDPRWQRKRLEVLQRENFRCEACGDTESTLHVHHGYYEAKYNPWDYDASTLHVLCNDCHEEVEELLTAIRYEVGRLSLQSLGGLFASLFRIREECPRASKHPHQEFHKLPINNHDYSLLKHAIEELPSRSRDKARELLHRYLGEQQ